MANNGKLRWKDIYVI